MKERDLFKKQKCTRRVGSTGCILVLFLIIAVAWYISTSHYQLMMIQGNSMTPSFRNMQLVLLDKHPETFTYGDVIAFQCDGLDAFLVKRVVACPEDTVQIRDGILFVNGEVSEVYGQEVTFAYAGLVEEELVLGLGEFFVVGDNVMESKDSRYEEVGAVCKESIIGRVIE